MLGRAAAPGRGGDVAALGGTDAWHPAIAGCDPVVNGAGMLQDGPCDDLRAVRALVRACLEVGDLRGRAGLCGRRLTRRANRLHARKSPGRPGAGQPGPRLENPRPGLVPVSTACGGRAVLRTVACVPLALPRLRPRRVGRPLTDSWSFARPGSAASSACPGRRWWGSGPAAWREPPRPKDSRCGPPTSGCFGSGSPAAGRASGDAGDPLLMAARAAPFPSEGRGGRRCARHGRPAGGPLSVQSGGRPRESPMMPSIPGARPKAWQSGSRGISPSTVTRTRS